ncbi:MAG: polysaccharide pyruvyl transferase family protein [Arenimonas sp.]|nr:polysaccharide pyruvyl transferase family protein [Rhizobium sp.]MBW8446874.1 polysaccharide pyruvyl transferase family protein [Arenimonas sp.]
MKKKSPEPKFGILHFSYSDFSFERLIAKDGIATINIGDYMQTLAARNLYSKIGIRNDEVVAIDRDKMRDYIGDDVIVIFNACFYKHCFPIPESIIPVFVGFQAAEDVIVQNRDYLKRFEPIGCRDVTTCDHLMSYGVSAFVTGCLTLSFDKRPVEPLDGRVVVVYGEGSGTLPGGALSCLPKPLYERLDFVFQRKAIHKLPLSQSEMMETEQHALALLERYRSSASLIVTPLHHAATPCISSGIPVVLCRRDVDDRFSFISKLIKVHTPADFAEIDWDPVAVDIDEVRSRLLCQAQEGVWAALERYQSLRRLKASTSEVATLRPVDSGRNWPISSNVNRALVDCIKSGDQAGAIDLYEKLTEAERSMVDANGFLCVGKAYALLRSPMQAIEMFRAALSLAPSLPSAHSSLITTLLAAGRIDDAFQASKQAEAACWSSSGVLLYAGRAALAAKETEAAIRRLERAVFLEPKSFPAQLLLAGTLGTRKGQWRKALAHARAALDISPDDLDARRVYGEACLHLGHWAPGFDNYQSRLHSQRLFGPFRRPFLHETWTGQEGVRTVLLLPETEQGIGFEMLASSLIPALEKKGLEVFFEATPKMLPIFAKMYPSARFFPFSKQGDPSLHNAKIDAQIYFSQACALLRRKQADFPPPQPLGSHVRSVSHSQPLRVGVSWKSKNPASGADRSIALEKFRALIDSASVPIRLVNLQYGNVKTEIRGFEKSFQNTIEFDESIDYFERPEVLVDTIGSVDVVVSADNSTLHFAGLLQKPTFALLPTSPHWTWGITQRCSVWFPTVQLFRKSPDDEWEDLFLAVCQQLNEIYAFSATA